MKKRVIIILVICLAGWLVIKHLKDPYAINKIESLQGISWRHVFGTDYLGRDLFSRIVHGSVYSLYIAFLALTGVVIISLLLGSLAGCIGGRADTSIMILADSLISIPSLILALVFAGLFSNSISTVMVALVISWSGKYIRYVRNLVLNIKKEEFILFAPLRGSFGSHAFLHHIIPNMMAELFSLFTTDLGKMVLSISGLSFLGIGAQPPTPELGTILFDGKAYFFTAPQLFIFPGIIIAMIVLVTQSISRQINKYWEVNND
ncbi:ABC transporter permease [Enterococcus sp. BWT-B8]|uniref:ABC transporter permease n=1 Tax=unclassified Enterococcus TaxID=2608891 RepID=UPI001E3FD042|nr:MULTISPECIES: ABC transporter permease [unclassified Enterococcus]MCB5950916.1 ABC transporter permease [Enterococcus sp. BWT-B8]MCB5955554.1 ABC transporter permease [Enterococcus sp. CWB-B31]